MAYDSHIDQIKENPMGLPNASCKFRHTTEQSSFGSSFSLSLIQPGKTISINRDLVNNQAKCSRKN